MRRVFRSPWPLLAAGVSIVVAGCSAMPGGGVGDSGGRPGFFVTSIGPGKGADLGGIAGADQHCQALAAAVPNGAKRTWRAYLSTQAAPAVNARDRIGKGPWYNVKGQLIARDVEELHGAKNNVTKQTALNEKGEVVNGRGDTPSRHDIMTGSRVDGTAFSPNDPDKTCGNWTRSGSEGAVMSGHHDRSGINTDPWSLSWNSSHVTRAGCSPEALKAVGGDGLFYCFAAD
jgi:hypothetical protein